QSRRRHRSAGGGPDGSSARAHQLGGTRAPPFPDRRPEAPPGERALQGRLAARAGPSRAPRAQRCCRCRAAPGPAVPGCAVTRPVSPPSSVAGTEARSPGRSQNLKAGELPQPSFRDEYNLGDVFLGVEYIYQQCQENGEDYYSILTVTAAHGLCHLLGYQHNTEAEWEQMYQKEKQILEELNGITGANLQPLTKNHF
uniref:YbeY metalloendoribonuclease n=1 Tax=Chrysemys picta bellii TaxID=8478 RepID=A0A8C3FFH3_CHRPI